MGESDAARENLAADKEEPAPRDVPLLLKIVVPYGGMLAGLMYLLILLAVIFGVQDFSDGRYSLPGVDAAHQPVVLLVVLATLSIGTAVAVLKEARWSRHLIMMCTVAWAASALCRGHFDHAVFSFGVVKLTLMIPTEILLMGFAAWYLYLKPNVATYYRSLGRSGART